MPPSSSTARTASAGASSDRRPNCRASTTSAPTRRPRPCFRTGGSPASSSARVVAAAALAGALEEIGRLGGGRVEGYPEDVEGRSASPSFLFNGALSTFEAQGFERSRRIGKHKWVVTRTL